MENLKLLAVCVITIIVVLSVQYLYKVSRKQSVDNSIEARGQSMYELTIMLNNLHGPGLILTVFHEYIKTLMYNNVDNPGAREETMDNLKTLVRLIEDYDPAQDTRKKTRID